MHMPSSLPLREAFFKIINECLILLNAFSASIEMIIWFLSFILLMWCIILTDLQILNNSCFPGSSVVRNLLANAGDTGLIPWVGKIPCYRKWQPAPVFLAGKSHGPRRSLLGHTPLGHKESDTPRDQACKHEQSLHS